MPGGRRGAMLDLDLLRTFVEVVDSASFTVAARRLEHSQSTVSLQIKRLEGRIGRPLLERTSRAVRVTAEGDTLLRYAVRLLRLHDDAVATLRSSGLAGRVRLGAPEAFAASHLAAVLEDFLRHHPKVSLEVRCDFSVTLLDGVRRGELDVALAQRGADGGEGTPEGVLVWREPMAWLAADAAVLSAADAAAPLVLTPPPCADRKKALDALGRSGRAWRVAYTTPSRAGALTAARARLGVAVAPRAAARDGLCEVGPDSGLPPLADSEIMMLKADGPDSGLTGTLAAHIARSLARRSDAPEPPPSRTVVANP